MQLACTALRASWQCSVFISCICPITGQSPWGKRWPNPKAFKGNMKDRSKVWIADFDEGPGYSLFIPAGSPSIMKSLNATRNIYRRSGWYLSVSVPLLQNGISQVTTNLGGWHLQTSLKKKPRKEVSRWSEHTNILKSPTLAHLQPNYLNNEIPWVPKSVHGRQSGLVTGSFPNRHQTIPHQNSLLYV